jgi:glycolate oxidase FAD binding subunit
LPISTVSDGADIAAELIERVQTASAERRALRIVGGNTKAFYGRAGNGEPLEMAGHRGVIAYAPSELAITARAGTPLAEIEALLAEHGQMLAFEPPLFGATSTIGGMVAAGLSGPRRPFAGAVRDHVLGVKVLDGQGRALRFGGTVFKNVAGFDAFRLMAGAMGCLGALLEVSLRVAPRPYAEASRVAECDWSAARGIIGALMRSPTPLSGAFCDGERLHLRFEGAEAAVRAAARVAGGESGSAKVWDDLRHMRLGLLAAPRLWRLSVPWAAELAGLGGQWLWDWGGAQRWLISDAPASDIRAEAARVGGHATLFRGALAGEEVFTPLPASLLALHQRLKAALDPAGVFNPGRMYEGL